MKVLITSGGTKVMIDQIRYIGNHSSGKTGLALAEEFQKQGAEVKLIRSTDAFSAPYIDDITYVTFDDLQTSVKHELSAINYQLIIHLAAVSDFLIDSIDLDGKTCSEKNLKKIESNNKLSIHLSKAPKIIEEIRKLAPNATLVAFKLTNTDSKDEQAHSIAKLFTNSNADFVVHNDFQEIKNNNHIFTLHDKSRSLGKVSTPKELATLIRKQLKDSI